MTNKVTVESRKVRSAGAWAAVAVFLGACAEGAEPVGGMQAAVTGSVHFVVDRADDSLDGACVPDDSSSGRCNLRAAVLAAAGVAGPAEIELAVDSIVSLGEIGVGGDDRLVIAAAAGGRIDGSNSARLFTVMEGATLVLEGVHVSHFAAYNGGAIDNRGSLELVGAVLEHNRASCVDVGAMTAFATCYGGAIVSAGPITLSGGTRFEDDSVTAEAYTAAFTNSWGGGGAIYTTAPLVVDGPVVFADNTAASTAVSGEHPIPVGGASAIAGGGAIYAGAGLRFTDRAFGHCIFQGNAAVASAQAPHGLPGSASSTGGAIFAGGDLELAEDACIFVDNQAATDPDVHAAQPGIPGLHEDLDAATQSIVFTPASPVQWVDLHLSINGERVSNVRMQAGPDGSFVVGPLALRVDDVLTYSFTYFDGAGHDTRAFTRVIPPTFEPKAFRPEVRGTANDLYSVRLVSNVSVTWADVHFTRNGGAQQNIRLQVRDGVLSQPLSLAVGDQLDYSMTYAANGYVFDTGRYRFRPTAPTASTVWTHGFPTDTPGQAVPSGCQPSGSWYSCAPFADSRVYTEGGYRFAGDATRVPFDITGTGPYGTSLIKTLQVALDYTGGTPRRGLGLVQLPSSAAPGGVPPVDADDRDRGKYVSPTWSLRASYLIGGDGLSVALIDVNGLRSKEVDVAAYRSSYCRYGCSLEVPVAVLASGTDIDLGQIRYVEFRSESGAVVDQTMTIGHLVFDDFDTGGCNDTPTPDNAWHFVASDLSPATSYAINGDQLDLNFNGYFSWNGTWASGYSGYTFERHADLVDGGTYQLTLGVSHTSNPIPAVLRASLSGGGTEQQATFFGEGSQTLTFTVSAPGCAPVLRVTAHPVLGHLGPTEGIGIGVQRYSVNAQLVRVN
jgi:Carbohydrate binding module family 56